MESYNDALTDMLQDCSHWDSEHKALKEAFDRGMNFITRQVREEHFKQSVKQKVKNK